jgi:hypothetical protein
VCHTVILLAVFPRADGYAKAMASNQLDLAIVQSKKLRSCIAVKKGSAEGSGSVVRVG